MFAFGGPKTYYISHYNIIQRRFVSGGPGAGPGGIPVKLPRWATVCVRVNLVKMRTESFREGRTKMIWKYKILH